MLYTWFEMLSTTFMEIHIDNQSIICNFLFVKIPFKYVLLMSHYLENGDKSSAQNLKKSHRVVHR